MSNFRAQYSPAEDHNGHYAVVDEAIESSARANTGHHILPTVATGRYTPQQVPNVEHTYSADVKNAGTVSYVVPSLSEANERRNISKQPFRQRYPALLRAVQTLTWFTIVGFVLTIPILVTYDAREVTDDNIEAKGNKAMVFYIFVMLLTDWIIIGIFYVVAQLLPYVFRAVAHYVNPAHERYWRVFVMMRNPIVIVFAVIGAWISLYIWIEWNPNMVVNVEGETSEEQQASYAQQQEAISVASDILFYFILWAGAFLLEKSLITYLTIHYHFRSHHHDILQSKRLLDTLAALYDYSYSAYPYGDAPFITEDWIIHNHQETKSRSSTIMGAADKISCTFAQAFGIVFGAEATSHWFSPRSTYAIIGQALQNPDASAALAKRIWVSLVPEGGDVLTRQDIKEALGPQKSSMAEEYFQCLDENLNGDIKLSEMIPGVVEAGRKRKNIYLGMADLTHVVNTLDWILIGLLAFIMLGLVLIIQVPKIGGLQQIIGFSAVGISFVVGRTLNEFIQGAIFTILDHPYDVGDVVEIHNLAESVSSLLLVKRISLLYTIFEEVGSGKSVQLANMRSKLRRISNLSRSGKNKEAITLSVDFGTSFKDLELLKQELQTFISAPENCRDYYPDLGLRVASLGDLSKLELRISFRHKSNWSNEALRAARSSRFHCAIVAAARKVPVNKPGGGKTGVGEEGKPAYTVMITDSEAATKRDADKEKMLKKRMDYVEPEKPAAAAEDLSSLSAEELRAAEEKAAAKKLESEKKAAKEAQEKADEDDAAIKMMGITRTTVVSRGGGATTGFAVDNGRNHFSFITGDETGRRPSRRLY